MHENIDSVGKDFSRTTILGAIEEDLRSEHPLFVNGSTSERVSETFWHMLEIEEKLRCVWDVSAEKMLSEEDIAAVEQAILSMKKPSDSRSSMLKYESELLSKIRSFRDSTNKDEKQRTSLLRKLMEYECMILERFDIHLSEKEKQSKPKLEFPDNNQIFLSYQYNDKLYTIGLYIIFKHYGWYLYVDWMHNDSIQDCDMLKKVLAMEVVNSRKFASLPHYKLLFGQPIDNANITAWCAWEIGLRYSYAKDRSERKYAIAAVREVELPLILQSFKVACSVDDIEGS